VFVQYNNKVKRLRIHVPHNCQNFTTCIEYSILKIETSSSSSSSSSSQVF